MGNSEPTDCPKATPRLKYERLGVWEVVILVQSSFKFDGLKLPSQDWLFELLSSFPYLIRLYKEIYALAPRQVCVYVFFSIFQAFEGTIGLYYNSLLLNAVSEQLSTRNGNTAPILRAIIGRFICAGISIWVKKTCRRDKDILRDRIKFHFMQKDLHVNLNLDLSTAEDPVIKAKLDQERHAFQHGNRVYDTFNTINKVLTGMATTFSQLALIFKVLPNDTGGLLFVMICLIQPLMRFMCMNSVWASACVSYCANDAFMEMGTLHQFAYDEKYRIDRLSDDVNDHIDGEFSRNREKLGDECTAPLYDQWNERSSVASRMFLDALDDLPLLAFGLKALLDPHNMSFSSLMIQQQAAQSAHWTLVMLTRNIQSIADTLLSVKGQYTAADAANKLTDGIKPYPSANVADSEFSRGMSIEFCNVSFAYPGTSKEVLKDVSFTIKSGQLVVIVGVNGSGKSSTIKLFNRLYDPTKGEILVDGSPLSSYRIKDIRRSMAMLRQDHRPYPVSIRRNVALGRSDRQATEEELQEALRLGGAQTFVQKLPKTLDNVLNPVSMSRLLIRGQDIDTLKKIVEERDKVTDISGGESQRLAAARTFMRLSGEHIRFLAADEPTSALDPEGEYELFTRLRQQRKGKTVVFITHRFGHLTKHADLILCMKEGRLVEQGTHSELIAKGGEYFRLHDVQAQAFVSTPSPE